jgi:hypothetical protein
MAPGLFASMLPLSNCTGRNFPGLDCWPYDQARRMVIRGTGLARQRDSALSVTARPAGPRGALTSIHAPRQGRQRTSMPDLERIVTAAGVVVAAAAATFALFQVVIAWRPERRREQPVVVAYQPKNGPRTVYLRNEGTGAAFNLTFGVVFGKERLPYPARSSAIDEEGDVSRALRPGHRLPKDDGHFAIELPSGIGNADVEPSAYWCRYHNAFRAYWETINPVAADAPFTIRRIPWWRRRERRGHPPINRITRFLSSLR